MTSPGATCTRSEDRHGRLWLPALVRWQRLCRYAVVLAVWIAAGHAVPAQDNYSEDGADTCLMCHRDDVTLALFRSMHAVPSDARGPFGHGQLQCEACHGPGGDHAGRVRRGEERPPVIRFGSGAATDVRTQNGMCLGCHAADAGGHGEGHAAAELACADCHVSHSASDPVMHRLSEPEVCYACHAQQRTRASKPYSHPVAEGRMACSDCHRPHDVPMGSQAGDITSTGTCLSCHAGKRGPFLWEHAPVTEDCSLCHAPHGSNHPGMLVRRAPMLCQSCHSQGGHPSIAQDAGGVATAMPSQFLLGQSCMNCHVQVHGSNHPSGSKLMR